MPKTARKSAVLTDWDDKPPITYNMTDEQYHGSSGVSRSGLWTIHNDTPKKFKFGEPAKTKPLALGSATHTAVLEPDEFETAYIVVEDNMRRGTKAWDAADLEAKAQGRELIKNADYTKAAKMRDSIYATSTFQKIMQGAIYEQAAYWIDDDTGVLCKCKPDIYNEKMTVLADVKSAANISLSSFGKSIRNYGYHVQDQFYMEGWRKVFPADAYLFCLIESEAPFDTAFYEIPPSAQREGHAIVRSSLATYAECLKTDTWPGYADKVVPCDMPKWGYDMTSPDDGE